MKSGVQNFTLYCFCFFINFQELKIFDLDFLSIPKIAGMLYFVTTLPTINKFLGVIKIKFILLPIGIFFAWLTIINVLNVNEKLFNFFNFSLFQNILLFWFLINHSRRDPLILEKALLSLAVGSIVLALLYKAGIGVDYTELGRISMFGDNENIIGFRMAISIFIIVLGVLQNRLELGWYRFLLLLPLPIMLELMAETGSRAAIIAFILAILIGGILYNTKNLWAKISIIIIISIVLVYFSLLIMKSEILMLRLLQSYEEGDLAGRDIIWQSLIPTIENNLIFGIGETGYAKLFGNASPHNVFLEILCYTGVLGLILYLNFLYKICIRAYKCLKSSGNMLPLLLLLPIFGFLFAGQILTQKLGWVIFAYIISISIFDSSRIKTEK